MDIADMEKQIESLEARVAKLEAALWACDKVANEREAALLARIDVLEKTARVNSHVVGPLSYGD